MSRNGKGDKRRPSFVSQKQYDKNYRKTFGKNKKKRPKGMRSIVVDEELYWWKVRKKDDKSILSIYSPDKKEYCQVNVNEQNLPTKEIKTWAHGASASGVTPDKVKEFIKNHKGQLKNV